MKILADAGPIYNGQLTGVGYFTDELLKHLSQNADLTGYAFNFRSKKEVSTQFPVLEQTTLPGKVLTYPRYLKIDLPLSTFFGTKSFDVVFGTNYLIPPTGKIPSIPTIHDLCFIDHPEWVQPRNAHILAKMLPSTLARSSALITVSKFTADRVREVYGYKKPIQVVSIPPKISSNEQLKPAEKSLSPKNFFLFVSTIEPRKNVRTLLDAYEALSPEQQRSAKLVLAGKPGWDADSLARLRGGENKNIIYLDYVSESERNWLYINCIATIIPSHYEGFGMMSLESLSAGSPTILSKIPPHLEILGDKGDYFDPLDVDELKNLLVKFISPTNQKSAYDKQKSVLSKYSWDRTALDIVKFIEKVIAK